MSRKYLSGGWIKAYLISFNVNMCLILMYLQRTLGYDPLRDVHAWNDEQGETPYS